MKHPLSLLQALRKLPRDERGLVIVLVTLWLPVIAGFFTLATDVAYVYWTRNQLQVAAEVAALAATAQLPDNGPCGTTGTACYIAKDYAQRNGAALADSDVLLGKWTDKCL